MRFFQIFFSVWFNKCPRCHQGQVFYYKNPYKLNALFKMHPHCNHCQLQYEREPSFFYGAMYVSYALTSGWFIIWYILYLTVLNAMDTLWFALSMAGSIILLSPITLRWSRLLWLNFFNSYQPFQNNKKPIHYDRST